MTSAPSDAAGPQPLDAVLDFLRELAPLEVAESWDNVGHLWGDAHGSVERVMTCLTLSPDVADEAIKKRAELIVVHHPILFRPVQRLTHETPTGAMLLSLARHGITVYSAHTAYDNAEEGINRQLADRLGLEAVGPLRLAENGGVGRLGRLPHPRTLKELIADVKRQLGVSEVQYVGALDLRIERIAIGCGSGAEFLDDALRENCQALLTGEARFHAGLEARERGLAMILLGHFASEQPAMKVLADQVRQRFPALTVWASTVESDPIRSA